MALKSALISISILVTVASAHAGCKEDVARLEGQNDQKAMSAIANSSGGQSTAARREAPQQGQGAGDQAMAAKVALNDAKVALGKGDEATCAAAVRRAQGHVDK